MTGFRASNNLLNPRTIRGTSEQMLCEMLGKIADNLDYYHDNETRHIVREAARRISKLKSDLADAQHDLHKANRNRFPGVF